VAGLGVFQYLCSSLNLHANSEGNNDCLNAEGGNVEDGLRATDGGGSKRPCAEAKEP
jgi:hypothetical protein